MSTVLKLRMVGEDGEEQSLEIDKDIELSELERELCKAFGFASIHDVLIKLAAEDGDTNISARLLRTRCLNYISEPESKPFGDRDLSQGLSIKVLPFRPASAPAPAPTPAPAPATKRQRTKQEDKSDYAGQRNNDALRSCILGAVRVHGLRRPSEVVKKEIDGSTVKTPAGFTKYLLQEKDLKTNAEFEFMSDAFETKRDLIFNMCKQQFPDLELSRFKVMMNKRIVDDNCELRKKEEAKAKEKARLEAAVLAGNAAGATAEVVANGKEAEKDLEKKVWKSGSRVVVAWKNFRGPKGDDGLRLHSNNYTAQLRMELTDEEKKFKVASASTSRRASSSLLLSGNSMSATGLLASLLRRASSASHPSIGGGNGSTGRAAGDGSTGPAADDGAAGSGAAGSGAAAPAAPGAAGSSASDEDEAMLKASQTLAEAKKQKAAAKREKAAKVKAAAAAKEKAAGKDKETKKRKNAKEQKSRRAPKARARQVSESEDESSASDEE